MSAVTTPMHRILVDADVHEVLGILFDKLLVELSVLVKEGLNLTVDRHQDFPFQQLDFTKFEAVAELTE